MVVIAIIMCGVVMTVFNIRQAPQLTIQNISKPLPGKPILVLFISYLWFQAEILILVFSMPECYPHAYKFVNCIPLL